MLLVVCVGISRSWPSWLTARRRYLEGLPSGSGMEWAWWIIPLVKEIVLCRVAGDVGRDLGVLKLLITRFNFWKGLRRWLVSSLSDDILRPCSGVRSEMVSLQPRWVWLPVSSDLISCRGGWCLPDVLFQQLPSVLVRWLAQLCCWMWKFCSKGYSNLFFCYHQTLDVVQELIIRHISDFLVLWRCN